MTKVSLIIPTRNNLTYLKCCYESIKNHLFNQCYICVADDFSNDGTNEWCKEISKIDSSFSFIRHDGPGRKGHCILYDELVVKLVKTDIFGIFHADMITTPTYIKNIVKHIKPGIVVSATRVEPSLHPPGPEKFVEDFGLEPESFREDHFLEFVNKQEAIDKDKTTQGIFAPWMMYKEDFFAIGGHDKRVFAPMELEDSDLFNRFLLAGYKFVQSRDSFCYHFTSRGSRFKDGVQTHMQIPLGNGKIWNKPKDSEEYINLRHIKFREWWRKWHMNVLHDQYMMPKVCKRYDVGFVVYNAGVLFGQLEPWCDTIYTDLQDWQIEQYIQNEQSTSKFNIRDRIKPISAEKTNNIIVEFDARQWMDRHWKFLEDLMFIIEDSGEVGEFEHDIFKFTIKSMESYESKLIHADDPWYLNKLNG
jgi:GT2 family glycosyltransferase